MRWTMPLRRGAPLRIQSSCEALRSHFTLRRDGVTSSFGRAGGRGGGLLVRVGPVVRMPPCGSGVPLAVSAAQKANRGGGRLRWGPLEACVNHRGTTRVGAGRSSPQTTRGVPYRRGKSLPRSTSGNGGPMSRCPPGRVFRLAALGRPANVAPPGRRGAFLVACRPLDPPQKLHQTDSVIVRFDLAPDTLLSIWKSWRFQPLSARSYSRFAYPESMTRPRHSPMVASMAR